MPDPDPDAPLDPDDDTFDDDAADDGVAPSQRGEAFWPADHVTTTASNPQPRARPPR